MATCNFCKQEKGNPECPFCKNAIQASQKEIETQQCSFCKQGRGNPECLFCRTSTPDTLNEPAEPKDEIDSQQTLFPNNSSYLLSAKISIVVVNTVSVIVAISVHFYWSLLCSILLSIFIWWWKIVSLKKEYYELNSDKIAIHHGTPISSNIQNVSIEEISFLQNKNSFLYRKIYGTGELIIDVYGAETRLRHLDNSEVIYQLILSHFEQKGYKLEQDKPVYSTTPNRRAVLLPTLGYFMFSIVIIMMCSLFFYAFLVLQETDFSDTTLAYFALGLGLLLSIPSALYFYLFYRDGISRTYTVNQGSIEYEDFFLTTGKSIIPMQKVADIEIKEGLLDSFFEWSDICISTVGVGKDIYFSNMESPTQFWVKAHSLLNRNVDIETPLDEEENRPTSEEVSEPRNQNLFSQRYTPLLSRALLESGFYFVILIVLISINEYFSLTIINKLSIHLIIFSLIFIFSPIIIGKWNTYSIENNTINYQSWFLSTTNKIFTIENVNMIDVRQNPFDIMMKTYSIRFCSVGAMVPIWFHYLQLSEEQLSQIISLKRKDGEQNSFPIKTTSFTILMNQINTILVGGVFIVLLSFIMDSFIDMDLEHSIIILEQIQEVFIWLVVSLVLYNLIYDYISQFYRNLTISGNSIIHTDGIIFRSQSYSSLCDIQIVTSKTFYLHEDGILSVRLPSAAMRIPYVIDIKKVQDTIDALLLRGSTGKELQSGNPLIEKPMVQNTLIRFLGDTCICGLIIFLVDPYFGGYLKAYPFGTSLFRVVIGFLFFFRLKLNIQVFFTTYSLEKHRVIFQSGIFSRSASSVLYLKVKQKNLETTFLNRVCNNQNVLILFELGRVLFLRFEDIKKDSEWLVKIDSHIVNERQN